MKKVIFQILLLIGLIILLGVATLVFKYDPKQIRIGDISSMRSELIAKKWTWVKTTSSDGAVVTPVQSDKFTLTFAKDSSVAITTDCNGGGGKYTATGSKLSFGEIASTLMYCDGSQETQFFSMINDVQGYTISPNGELTLNLTSGGKSEFK